MPYDSLVLHNCINNLKPQLNGAKVNKIHQPDEHTVIIRYRSQNGSGKLLLSAHPVNGRLHRTEAAKQNPAKAPQFVMVLRKWLEGSRITNIVATPDERVAELIFDAKNDLGDSIVLRLIIEIMGKHSNIILVDGNNTILDGIKRYGSHLSRYREVLPGKEYIAPPPMNKLPLLPKDESELAEALYAANDMPLSKALGRCLKGVSPILGKNIPLMAGLLPDTSTDSLGEYEFSRIYSVLRQLREAEINGGSPVIKKDGDTYTDYYLFAPPQWEGAATIPFSDMNEAVDAYYIEQDRLEELAKGKQHLRKAFRQNQARLERKISLEEADLANCEAADAYKDAADLLAANMYYLEKGKDKVLLPSFADPDRIIEIKMDPAKTPQENVTWYYKKYNKAKKARVLIEDQLCANRQELDYLQTIQQSMEDCQSMEELQPVEKEAIAGGFCKPRHQESKSAKNSAVSLPPRKYFSADGFTILIGRNNKQNDRLSLKQSAENDIWLHTSKIPGSHTIIVTEGKTVPESTIIEAASYAAWFSKAKESGKTPVDYTLVKYLKKPNGAVPGYVTFSEQTTVYVEPKEPKAPEKNE